MKKILSVYDKVAEWLCHFGGDKYVHLIVGLLIGFFGAQIFYVTTPGVPASGYAFSGVVAAVIIMFTKEVIDFIRESDFSVSDWVFGMIGGLIGALLWMV